MDPTATPLTLLPAFQLEHEPVTATTNATRSKPLRKSSASQSLLKSALPTRVHTHCDDPDCFIASPFTQEQRWKAFDAFDPREVDDYGFGSGYASTPVHPYAFGDATRRLNRAAELRMKATARLMPYGRVTNASTRRSVRRLLPLNCYSTPSPLQSPLQLPAEHEPMEMDVFPVTVGPQTPRRTPYRALTPSQTPTLTITSPPSRTPSPMGILCFPSTP